MIFRGPFSPFNSVGMSTAGLLSFAVLSPEGISGFVYISSSTLRSGYGNSLDFSTGIYSGSIGGSNS